MFGFAPPDIHDFNSIYEGMAEYERMMFSVQNSVWYSCRLNSIFILDSNCKMFEFPFEYFSITLNH